MSRINVPTPTCEEVWLVCLEDLSHEALGQLVPRLGQSLLQRGSDRKSQKHDSAVLLEARGHWPDMSQHIIKNMDRRR